MINAILIHDSLSLFGVIYLSAYFNPVKVIGERGIGESLARFAEDFVIAMALRAMI